jgi:hypothetical protein
VAFARLNGDNHFPYGSAEHLAFELRKKFGAEVGMWAVLFCCTSKSVAHFLAVALERFGVKVAQYCAMYLDSFNELPRLMDQTREEIILSNLDFDVDSDPDLRRWEDGV